MPLALIFLVSRITGASCAALTGATVDVWHCDAVGVYSDANDPSFAGTKGAKFLRGYQTTAANGQRSDFTSQVFFDDALNDQVFTQAPYAQKGTAGRTRNTSDGLFQGSGGKLTLSPTKRGDGYAATFDIGLAV